MTVVYDASVKTSRMTATRDDAASGILEIWTSGYATLLASFPLHTTGGDIAGAVWTLKFTGNAGALTVSAAAAGTAAAARVRNSGDTVTLVNNMTVGTSGTDVIVDNTNIASGQNVTCNSATITHAA